MRLRSPGSTIVPKAKHRTRWTAEEDDFLRAHYSRGDGAKKCRDVLSRTPAAITARANKLGVCQAQWTLAEDAVLRQHYLVAGADACAGLISTRKLSRAAVHDRARTLGLAKTIAQSGRACQRWTPAEDDQIKQEYATLGAIAIHEKMSGRSIRAIEQRAYLLKVTKTMDTIRTITIESTTGGDRRYAVESTTPVLLADSDAPDVQRWALTVWRRVQRRGYVARLAGTGPDAATGDHGIYAGAGAITAAALINAWPETTEPPSGLLQSCRRYDQAHGDWLPAEDKIIKKHYPTGGADACLPAMAGRRRNSIQKRAGELGLTRKKSSSSRRWSTIEDDLIRANYADVGGSALTEKLPGRSAKAIRLRAARLGVATATNKQDDTPWSVDEDHLLRINYPLRGSAPIVEATGRTQKAVQARAHQLRVRYITR